MSMVQRVRHPAVALETTLLVHGVPRSEAAGLGASLEGKVRGAGAHPVLVGVHAGRPVVGLTGEELADLLGAARVAKVNTSNLGIVMHRGQHGATTVSATVELCAGAGVRLFASGGLGGVHRNLGSRLDISADLAALARHPVAVVCSGVKSLLDVASSRELLETLGVPVVGFQTEHFPAFYCAQSGAKNDARFDDADDLARFIDSELTRTNRGIVVANPVPASFAIEPAVFDGWLGEAEKKAGATGRDVTPALLDELHRISGGATLRANIALAEANAALAGRLAAGIAGGRGRRGGV